MEFLLGGAVPSNFLFDNSDVTVSIGVGKPRSFQKKPVILSLVLYGL